MLNHWDEIFKDVQGKKDLQEQRDLQIEIRQKQIDRWDDLWNAVAEEPFVAARYVELASYFQELGSTFYLTVQILIAERTPFPAGEDPPLVFHARRLILDILNIAWDGQEDRVQFALDKLRGASEKSEGLRLALLQARIKIREHFRLWTFSPREPESPHMLQKDVAEIWQRAGQAKYDKRRVSDDVSTGKLFQEDTRGGLSQFSYRDNAKQREFLELILRDEKFLQKK